MTTRTQAEARIVWRHLKSDGRVHEITADVCADHLEGAVSRIVPFSIRRYIARHDSPPIPSCSFCAGEYVGTREVSSAIPERV